MPAVCITMAVRPLHGRREIADDSLKPDVDSLVVVAVEGNRHSPLNIARDGPSPEPLLDHVSAELDHVGPPVVLVGHPLQKPLREGGQVQEEVLGFAHDGSRAVALAAGLDQLHGVQEPAAVVALIPARLAVAAVGACALDVSIREESLLLLAVEEVLLLLVEILLLEKPGEDVLGHGVVILRVGVGKQIEGDSQVEQRLQDAPVVAKEELLRGHALRFGRNCHGGAVGIGTGDHQDVVPRHAMVARKDVGGHEGTGHVAQVQVAVRVWPGDEDANVGRHVATRGSSGPRSTEYIIDASVSCSTQPGFLDTRTAPCYHSRCRTRQVRVLWFVGDLGIG